MSDSRKMSRNSNQERYDLIRDLRNLVLEHEGPIETSPHYDHLARLMISELIIGNYPEFVKKD
jgi:hypothetical protein